MAAHALLIGISRFDDPKLAKLESPKGDVEALANVLRSPDRGAFDSVTVSIDKDLMSIRDNLSVLFDGRSADDMVLLYYSGHGIVAKGQRLYLATGQSSFDRPQARSIATSEIRDMMEQTRAGRLVVLLDCCHSGVFAEGAKGAAAPALTDTTFGSGEGSEGQYILTATDSLQYAFDGSGKLQPDAGPRPLSRFTSWLVDGIAKGEASPYEDQITLDALYQYLCKRARTEQAGMTPQRFVKRGSGELVIAKNPSAKALALPDDLVGKLDSTEWRVRKDALGELAKVAKQPRMGPLAKKAVTDRISEERDVDVREAMVNLLQRLGAEPVPEPNPDEPELVKPEPPRPAPFRPEPVPPRPQPKPQPISPMQLPNVDEWQTRVLVKSGVATPALLGSNGPYLLMELERRANGLRTATYMHRAYIAGIIFFGLAAIGQLSEGGEVDGPFIIAFVLIGFGIAGLLNRKTLAVSADLTGDPEAMRMQEAVPLMESRWGWGLGWSPREYEAKLFHRTCLWMAIGGAITFVAAAMSN